MKKKANRWAEVRQWGPGKVLEMPDEARLRDLMYDPDEEEEVKPKPARAVHKEALLQDSKPCAHCRAHFFPYRLTQQYCSKACRDRSNARHYAQMHPEQAKEKCRTYHEEHKDQQNAKARTRRAQDRQDPEKVTELRAQGRKRMQRYLLRKRLGINSNQEARGDA